MADTLLDLKALIADDLARGDLTTQIATEIQNAISRWQTERFYFNESRAITFNTVADQEFYTSSDHASIPNLLEIDSFVVTANSDTYPLTSRTYEWTEDTFTITSITGQPTDYAYYGQTLRLYPTPDDAYSCRISAVVRLTALSSDSDSNAWTKAADAQDLIRAETERRIYMFVIKDPDLAAASTAARDDALSRLKGETERRIGRGTVVPSSW